MRVGLSWAAEFTPLVSQGKLQEGRWGLERLWADQGTWGKGEVSLWKCSSSMDPSGCFWRMGGRGQVGTESQSNSNHLGDSRPGFRLRVWETEIGKLEMLPRNQLRVNQWMGSFWFPVQQENTTVVDKACEIRHNTTLLLNLQMPSREHSPTTSHHQPCMCFMGRIKS